MSIPLQKGKYRMKIFRKQTILALLLSAAALLTVPVSAEDAAFANDATPIAVAAIKKAPELKLKDRTQIKVTSSDAAVPGASGSIVSGIFFDGYLSTGFTASFVDLPADAETDEAGNPVIPENAETASAKILSVYTATRTPEAVRSIAAILAGDGQTVLGVSVYGTNDSLQLDWTQLDLKSPAGINGPYTVFEIESEAERYSFYRIDIEVVSGSTFTLSELLLYKDADDTAVYRYESDGEVAAGETPKLVEVPEEKVDLRRNMFDRNGFRKDAFRH